MDVRVYVNGSDDLRTAAALVDRLGLPADGEQVRVIDCVHPPPELSAPLPDADVLPLTEIDGVHVVVGRLPSDDELEWLLDNAATAQALARGESREPTDRFPTSRRLHINLQVHSLDESLPFYEVLFGAKPTKRRRDYAKFELLDPPVNFALEEVGADKEAKIDHVGLEVKTPDDVLAARARYLEAGFKLTEELNVECCYSVQSKVWAIDPNGVRWETVNVVGDVDAAQACPDDCICWNDFDERDRSYPAQATAANGDGDRETAARVQQVYETVAQQGESGLCCDPASVYSPEELAALPEEVRALSSGCGSPVRLSRIRPGQTVVDIGAGAGADCLLAAKLTGPQGRVIGVDPSPTMRRRASQAATDLGYDWVTFTDGSAEELRLADASADMVISNCVLAMSTRPTAVWSEISRVLRPGGSFVVADTVGSVSVDTPDARARCEVGLSWRQYLQQFHQAGLGCIAVQDAGKVHYRDGQRVQSATLTGRRRPSHPAVAIQVFHSGGDTFAAALQHQLDWQGTMAELTHHDPTRLADRRLLDVLLGEDIPELDPTSALVFVDGHHMGTWSVTDDSDAVAAAVARRITVPELTRTGLAMG